LVFSILPKNERKKSTTLKAQVNLFSFVFWKNLKTVKRHFEINGPLAGVERKFLKNKDSFFGEFDLQLKSEVNKVESCQGQGCTKWPTFL
jgi:hypothetical protein